MGSKQTVKIEVNLSKPFHDDVSKFLSENPYYENIEDFIVEATRRHIQNLRSMKIQFLGT